MANVKLKQHRVSGPLLLRRAGANYALTAQEETKVPLGIAVGMLGDSGLIVEFTASDEAELLTANEYTLDLLRREFGLEGDVKAIQASMFPKKQSLAAKAVEAVTPTPKQEVVVEEPTVEESEEETIDYSKYTVKQLKEMLEEKGLSTEGKKADLVERMTGAE